MNKNKLVVISGLIIGVIFLLILILWIVSLFSNKYYTYEEFEVEVITACKNYYKKYPEVLPTVDGEYSVDYNALVQEKLIKPLNEMIENGNNCTINILLNKKSNTYVYTPFLNCPGKYETKELSKKILEQNQVVTSGNGLYIDNNGNYFFKGEIKNNYIRFGNYQNDEEKPYLWKIVGIEKDGTIRVVSTIKTENKYIWDDRYNADKNIGYGYNIFEKSRIKDTLKSFETSNEILNEEYKSKFVPKKLCVAAAKETDNLKDETQSCSLLTEDQYLFNTIYPYEYLRASLDKNCVSITSPSCSNYNFLVSEIVNSWSITPYANDSYKVYYFNGKDYYYSKANSDKRLYPAGYLNSKTFYKSGVGTMEDPYIIR